MKKNSSDIFDDKDFPVNLVLFNLIQMICQEKFFRSGDILDYLRWRGINHGKLMNRSAMTGQGIFLNP